MEVNANPTDAVAMSTTSKLNRQVRQIDSKFVQPGFKFKSMMMKDAGYYTPSMLNLTFVNGYTRSYPMGLSLWANIRGEIEYINNLVEFEHNMQGQDDELEDDQ